MKKPKMSEEKFAEIVKKIRDIVMDNESGMVFILKTKGEKKDKEGDAVVSQAQVYARYINKSEAIMGLVYGLEMDEKELLGISLAANNGSLGAKTIKSIPRGFTPRKTK